MVTHRRGRRGKRLSPLIVAPVVLLVALGGLSVWLLTRGQDGDEYFRMTRIELYDAAGNLVKTITPPKGPLGAFLTTGAPGETPFSEIRLYADWVIYVEDYVKGTPPSMRMNYVVTGKTSNGYYSETFVTKVWMLTWAAAGTGRGQPFADFVNRASDQSGYVSGKGLEVCRINAAAAESIWASKYGYGVACFLQYQLDFPDCPGDVKKPTSKAGGNIVTIYVTADPQAQIVIDSISTGWGS